LVDAKPIQSFLRRRSLSNQRNIQNQAANEQPKIDSDVTNKTTGVQSQVLTESAPPVAKVIGRRRSSSPSVVPQMETKSAPVKLKRKPSASDSKVPSVSPVPTNENAGDVAEPNHEKAIVNGDIFSNEAPKREKSSTIAKELTSDKKNNVEAVVPETKISPVHIPEPSREDIQEALDEKKRLREQDMLSDDEFEKEMNDLLSEGDDDDDVDDVNDDDFMMELEQMIDS